MTRGRSWVLLVVGLGCVAAAAAAVTWMLGRQRAVQGLVYADVSAGAAAQAMQADHFFSDFGDKILVVHGTVADVHSADGRSVVSLATGLSFGFRCSVPASSGGGLPAAGSVVTVVAPGATAERQPSSVDLPDCRIMSGP